MTRPDDAAFFGKRDNFSESYRPGLSKREYFALQILAHKRYSSPEEALALADKLIDLLNKTTDDGKEKE